MRLVRPSPAEFGGAVRQWVRAFRRDERGATAVELAILGVPFFALIGAILETALVFLASQTLDSAVQDASRYVRTGQVQAITNYNGENFRTAICNHLFGLFDCTKLMIVVSPVTSFSSATIPSTPPKPTDPTQYTLKSTFDPGTGSSVVMVQVYYWWPTFMNFGGFRLGSAADGSYLMSTVRVFKNEPFTGTS
jgi:Flp pilus assembly protein TadG